MSEPEKGWSCAHALRLDRSLTISFQRYARPPDGLVPAMPRSLGALPVASGPGGVHVVPLADDEAFWLGLSLDEAAPPLALACAVIPEQGAPRDAITGKVWDELQPGWIDLPQCRWLDGISRADGRKTAFMRHQPGAIHEGCRSLQLHAAERDRAMESGEGAAAGIFQLLATVHLETHAAFSVRSGCPAPAPMDEGAAYGGWRLP